MPQLRYELDMAGAFAGMKADLAPDYRISRAAETAVAFGLGVEAGTDPNKECVPFAGGTFLGMSVHTHKEDGQYNVGDSVAVVRTGAFYVALEATTNVESGAVVYCNDTTGKFQVAATGGTLVANASFLSGPVAASGLTAASNTENVAVVQFK